MSNPDGIQPDAPRPRPRADDIDDDDDSYDVRIRRAPNRYVLAQLAHWGGFLTRGIIPAILYFVEPDKGSFVAWHAREALNLQISLMLFYMIVGVPLGFAFNGDALLFVGLLILGLVTFFELVCIVFASLAVARGQRYRYPLIVSIVPRPQDPREDNDYVDRQ